MREEEPGLALAPQPGASAPEPYRVLARKHRPQTFDALIGQEAMVRTLRNAFAAGRIAHAFVLTGVRGVGKTTTARIIAKGLNCLAAPGPTIAPCGVCDACRRIAEGRFVDVLEIDAASNNGVDFVRELNDLVRTLPTARYRVLILDEAHMLSTQAWNALLKTLEEPPAHTKFLMATTEIRKIPVTVLSRCQRFDLRRIEPETMLDFLRGVCAAEGAAIGDEALALIARAAEGSARDALSLLDQAIAHGADDAEGARAMLGLADRMRGLDLFERIMAGDAAGALAELGAQHADGADPAAVMRGLAELAHALSMARAAPEAEDPTAPAAERARVRDLAARLSMRALARAWQMLLKALEEVALAPSALMAAEMAVIRLTHVADLPAPEELVRRLTEAEASAAAAPGPVGRPSPAAAAPPSGAPSRDGLAAPAGPAGRARPPAASPGVAPSAGTERAGDGGAAAGATPRLASSAASPMTRTAPAAGLAPSPALETGFAEPAVAATRGVAELDAGPGPERLGAAAAARAPASPRAEPDPTGAGAIPAPAAFPDLEAVAALIRARRDAKLLVEVESHLRPVRVAPGRIEFEPGPGAPPDLAGELTRKLSAWTGARWVVTVASAGGGATLAQTRAAMQDDLRARAEADPLVRRALELFPGARIKAVRPFAAAPPDARDADALDPEGTDDAADWAPPDDGWEPVDPFDEE